MADTAVLAGPPITRLSADDLTNLATDGGSVPMQIGAVLLLDDASAPPAAEVASVVEQRIARVPRLQQRLRRPPRGCGRPYWESAPEGATGLVTIAPAPVDEARMVDAAVQEVLHRLPRDRPLWRAVVYADAAGRTRAGVVVMHHVLADGIGGLAVLAELVDGGTQSPAPVGGLPPPSRRELLRDAWARRRAAVRAVPTTMRGLAAGLRELGGIPRPQADPCSLLHPTSPCRRVEVVEVPLAPLVDAAHRRGATVNDVLLVAMSGALRRLLRARGDPLGDVVVSVPVSGRSAASGQELGNQVGVLPLTVPLVDDPAVRLAAVRRQRARLGTAAPRASSGIVLSVLFRGLAALGVFTWFINHQRLVHTFLTNLRGPAEPLALAGTPIRRIVPVALTPGNTTITFDALSYAGRLLVSVLYDPDHAPDHALLRDALEDQLREEL